MKQFKILYILACIAFSSSLSLLPSSCKEATASVGYTFFNVTETQRKESLSSPSVTILRKNYKMLEEEALEEQMRRIERGALAMPQIAPNKIPLPSWAFCGIWALKKTVTIPSEILKLILHFALKNEQLSMPLLDIVKLLPFLQYSKIPPNISNIDRLFKPITLLIKGKPQIFKGDIAVTLLKYGEVYKRAESVKKIWYH